MIDTISSDMLRRAYKLLSGLGRVCLFVSLFVIIIIIIIIIIMQLLTRHVPVGKNDESLNNSKITGAFP